MSAKQPVRRPLVKMFEKGIDPGQGDPAHPVAVQKPRYFTGVLAERAEILIQDVDPNDAVALVSP